MCGKLTDRARPPSMQSVQETRAMMDAYDRDRMSADTYGVHRCEHIVNTIICDKHDSHVMTSDPKSAQLQSFHSRVTTQMLCYVSLVMRRSSVRF
jgi:hypothetical protein